jgi:hypothetical protein
MFVCVSLFLSCRSSKSKAEKQQSRKKAEKKQKKTKHLGYLMVGSETNEKDLPSATATAVELLK